MESLPAVSILLNTEEVLWNMVWDLPPADSASWKFSVLLASASKRGRSSWAKSCLRRVVTAETTLVTFSSRSSRLDCWGTRGYHQEQRADVGVPVQGLHELFEPSYTLIFLLPLLFGHLSTFTTIRLLETLDEPPNVGHERSYFLE